MVITLSALPWLNMNMQKLWLVLSKDGFVCADNLKIISKIAEDNFIDNDSISVFDNAKFDMDEMADLAQTVSFFGDRLIIIKDFDIADLSDEYVDAKFELFGKTMIKFFLLSLRKFHMLFFLRCQVLLL